MIKRPSRHTPNRTRLPVAQQPPLAQIITAFTIDGDNALLTFNAPVVVRTLPLEITRQAAGAGPQLVPVAFTQPTGNTLSLEYASPVVATDVLTIPSNLQSVRGTAGGYLAAAVHTF